MNPTLNGSGSDDRPILIPLDGSAYADAAIPYAVKLAGGQRSLALIRVLPDVRRYPILWQPLSESAEEASHRFQSAALRDLEAKAQSCARAYGLTVDAAVAVGEPAEAILRYAGDRDASMIVMSSAGLGALDLLAFGSVTDRVIRQAPVPVFVVRPDGERQGTAEIRRLIVPLDGSRRAMGALPVAAELSNRLGVPIALVTVIDSTRAVPPTMAYEAAISGGFPGEVLAGLQGDAQRTLDAAAAELKAPDRVTRFVKYGSVATSVAAMCGPGDAIVMATHGGGHEGWPIGSVAGMLVRAAPVPVLLVRTAAPRELELVPLLVGSPTAESPAGIGL
jgi:nucleotide-binding universal stress UspA family protein